MRKPYKKIYRLILEITERGSLYSSKDIVDMLKKHNVEVTAREVAMILRNMEFEFFSKEKRVKDRIIWKRL